MISVCKNLCSVAWTMQCLVLVILSTRNNLTWLVLKAITFIWFNYNYVWTEEILRGWLLKKFLTNMNVLQVGKNVNKWLVLLSARQVFPFGMGDENIANSKHGGKDIFIIVQLILESFRGLWLMSMERYCTHLSDCNYSSNNNLTTIELSWTTCRVLWKV